MRKELNAGNGFAAVIPFLERLKAVWSFEGDWGGPPEYDVLLRRLPKIWSQWPVTGIAVQRDEREPGISREVSLRLDGLPVCFAPKPMGDWVDVDTVLEGLNAALGAAGRPERFAVLLGDLCHVIVGTPDGLHNLVETLDLPLVRSGDGGTDDAGSAIPPKDLGEV